MNKWFNSKFYFLFWMFLALIPMKFSFDVTQDSGHYEESSTSEEDPTLAQIKDEELLKILVLDDQQWDQAANANPYTKTPAQLEQFEKDLRESSGLGAEDPIDFTSIAGDEALVNYEDVSVCSKGKNKTRANIENVIEKATKDPVFAEGVVERSIESQMLPRKCVTHVMNKFNIGKGSLARCPGGAGTPPTSGGSKPCVSKNLVNLTYNHFTDVAECFNIDPKDLLPKLSNESGMLINTLGAGLDAGVGQLTGSALEEVNKHFYRYMAEVEKAAIKKPSCQRLMQSKKYIYPKSKAEFNKLPESSVRCSFIALPHNPLKNIVYMAIYNRLNLDHLMGTKFIAGDLFIESNGQLVALTNTPQDQYTSGRFGENQIQNKFAQLGLSDVNVPNLATMIAFAGYNTGPSTAFNMLNEYLTKRVAAKKPLTDADFDFHNPATAKDIDGKVRPVTEIANLFVKSPVIRQKDSEKIKKDKLKRVKLLPEKIRKAHLLTFPEFMIYNQNNFDSSILNPKNLAKVEAITDPEAKAIARNKYERFSPIGAPGYLTFLASKDIAIRNAFENSGADRFYCSNPNFLKIINAKPASETPIVPAPAADKPNVTLTPHERAHLINQRNHN